MTWLAQYEQFGTWHDMKFSNINVSTQPGGLIQGQGQDEPGPFTFEGSFSPNAPTCRILKKYPTYNIYY